MGQNYPDNEEFAYSLESAEITANKRKWTAVSNISMDQPTEEGAVHGTRMIPLKRTRGKMGLGEGGLTFSDLDEYFDFIDSLGDGYRDVIWGCTYVLRHLKSGKTKKVELISCRVLGNPLDHEEGADALAGEISFSFMDHKINGKRPHK